LLFFFYRFFLSRLFLFCFDYTKHQTCRKNVILFFVQFQSCFFCFILCSILFVFSFGSIDVALASLNVANLLSIVDPPMAKAVMGTVSVGYTTESPEGVVWKSMGAGFIVSPNHVLTTFHLVQQIGNQQLNVCDWKGNHLSPQKFTLSNSSDVVLLHFLPLSFPPELVLQISSVVPKLLATSFTIGYYQLPFSNVPLIFPCSVSGFRNSMFALSAMSGHICCGAPVVDLNGVVQAMVTKTEQVLCYLLFFICYLLFVMSDFVFL
jgi:hypothetical protein